jgi:DNA polymerase-1
MNRTLILDGDITVYQLAARMETPIDFGDGLWVLFSDEKEAVGRLEDYLEGLKQTLEADKIIIALSDTKNFRKTILPSYKENRKGKRKPMLLPMLRQYMVMQHDALIWSELEGDDLLGIYGSEPNMNERIVVSMDKDLKTVPCKLYNTNRPEEGITTITEDEADYWHLYQTLTGDPTDGYSGCPSVGDKTARKILGDNPTWGDVVAAYEKRGLTEEDAMVQARVARILRFKDYDFTNNKPILWEAKKENAVA